MKKFIYGGLLIFILLCLFAVYQSGVLSPIVLQGSIMQRPDSTGPNTDAEVDTAFLDQVAASVLSQQGLPQESGTGQLAAPSMGNGESGANIFGAVGNQPNFSPNNSLFGGNSIGSSALGRVVPQVEALLSSTLSGNVIQIYVEEGDFVALGDVLLQLDDSMQKAAVAEHQAALIQAEAELAKLQSPARAEEVDAAQASLDAAKAELQRLVDSVIPGRRAIAQASLSAAEAGRNQVAAGPTQASVLFANAELEGAELYLEQAQRAYDQVAWRNDVGMLPESRNLQDATVQYNEALAKVQAARTGATLEEISGASANVERYEAELAMIESSLPAEQEALEANVRYYESRLKLLMAEPAQADIDAAAARVSAAEARLARSTAELTNTALRAPFSGTVATIEPSIGERVKVGDPVIRLADLTSWQIETADLSELDLANLTLGGPTTIQFDAIPDLELSGIVKSIRPFGEGADGDTYYKATILPNKPDDRLRWNMTALITFAAEN